MRLRTRNLLLLVPLFVALGLGLALPGRQAVQREFDWAVRETAGALAVSVAEFAQRCPADDRSSLELSLGQLVDFGQALEVAIYDASGSICAHAGRPGAEALPQGPALPEEASPTDTLGVGPLVDTERLPYVQGWAAMLGDGEHPPALAVVRIDASWVAPRQQTFTRRFTAAVLLIIALGLATTLHLSLRLERELAPLQTAAESIARRQTELDGLGGRRVRETQDLAETLTTVAAVLRNALKRGRRRLHEDPELDHAMLASLKQATSGTATPGEHDTPGFTARNCGLPPTGHHRGLVDGSSRRVRLAWCAVVDRGDAVDDELAAQASSALLRRELERYSEHPVADADLLALAERLRDLAGLDGLALAEIRNDEQAPDLVRSAAVGATWAEADGSRVLLHTLGPAGHVDARRCFALSRGRSASATADFLVAALAPAHRGTLCIVSLDDR